MILLKVALAILVFAIILVFGWFITRLVQSNREYKANPEYPGRTYLILEDGVYRAVPSSLKKSEFSRLGKYTGFEPITWFDTAIEARIEAERLNNTL